MFIIIALNVANAR